MPIVPAVLSCLLAMAVLPREPAGDSYTSLTFGVRVPLPEGWTHREDVSTHSNLHVVFAPLAAAKSVQLTLRAQPSSGLDATAAQAVSFSSVNGKEGYQNLAKRTDTMLGMELPGLQVDLDTPAGPFTLRQNYYVREGVLFIIECAVAVDEFEERIPAQLEFWEGLEFLELTPEQEQRRRLEGLAGMCGSEIDWAPSWEIAAERARAEGKLIVLTTQQYAGFDIEDQSMRGVFMDEDVIALVGERYVPFRLKKGMPTVLDAPEVYGLGPNTFGRAVMIVTPDGEVLAEQQSASERFLRESLVLMDASAGGAGAGGDGVMEAERLARRGEFRRARAALRGHATVEAELLRASMFRRERRRGAALSALMSARRIGDGDDSLADVLIEEAGMLASTGDPEQSRAKLDHYFEHYASHERAAEATYMLAMLKSAQKQRDAAGTDLQRVVDDHGDSRWAWLAAAALTSTGWKLGLEAKIGWPPEATDEVLRQAVAAPERAPGRADDLVAVRAAAVRYLLDHQRADGSWVAAMEASREPDVPDDFQLAIAALSIQALLTERFGSDADHARRVQNAIERGLAWLNEAHDRQIRDGEEPYYMDYSVWSRSYLVWALVDAYENGFVDRDKVQARITLALSEMRKRQQSGGGWSYYLTGDLDSEAGPADVSISFTTAAAVLAMSRVREMGLDVPPRMLESAVDCLARMRNGDGTWTYMLHHQDETKGRPGSPAGETARGPLCARALMHGLGDYRNTDELVRALDLYVQHRAGFNDQLGKTLMHTGPAGQGSHYLMFDYANTAAAIAELPNDRWGSYADAVLEDVLNARTEDGSFVDTMLLGRAYGTAMAVLALDHLGAGVPPAR